MTSSRAVRPGRTAGAARDRYRLEALALTGLSLLLAAGLPAGCGLDGRLPPNPVVVLATPVARNVRLPDGALEERRRLVDGDATDPEWNQVPYAHIAVGPENGNRGGSFVVSLKVAHDSTRIYMLIQWPDDNQDRLGPRLVWDPSTSLSPTGCDSLLVECSWTLTQDDEDRVAIMWDMGDARDGSGTFREQGCQVACHGNMHPLSGSVDIWHWRAARTNPIQFPLIGSLRVGFADDGYADGGGRVDDPGSSFYNSNVVTVNCGGGRRGVRPLKIPTALDDDNRPTIARNDFMRPCEYIFDGTAFTFNHCSRRNPCRLFEQENVVDWVEGDDLSAFLLSRPASAAARRSRHDVEARGRWEGTLSGGSLIKGVWTVEMSRILALRQREDIDFDVNRAEPYTMALAIMNNSGRIHAGSPPIQVRFRP